MSSVHARRQLVGLGRGILLAGVALALGTETRGQEAQVPLDYDAAIAQTGMDGSYGYFRAIDGTATLIQAGTNERVRVEVNEPILVGDRVFISGGSRAELVLADRNVVRVGDDAELGFRALAYSGDTNDATSVLDLRRGTLQLVVVRDQLGQEYPSVLTPNSSVRALEDGAYLIVVDDDRRTEVVVREGRAEVLTDDQNAEVRPGESLFVEGARGQDLQWASAPSYDRLERWGDGLAEYDTGDYARYVDSDLHYSASSLAGHGSWIDVGGHYAWRPYVSVGWAPYRYGRWRYTPTGLFWVSYEPWGWVPYHYGYWDHHDAYGWVWYPGRRFASAHVYWYWGPRYAGWVPSGYYWRHYGYSYGSRFGFYFGVYGHIGGGGYGPYRHWSFLPHGRLAQRRQHFYTVDGYDLGRRRATLERGVLLTDTRSLRPDAWRRPTETLATLRRAGARDGRDLPDARAFVERSPRLPERLERITLTGRDGRSTGDVRSAGGAARTRTADERPSLQARRVDGRSPTLEGRTVPGRATGNARSTERAGAQQGETLRRPTTRGSESRTQLQRPGRTPSVDEGARARPSTRGEPLRPTVRQGERSGSRPAARGGDRSPTRPTVRPSTSERRPTVQRSGGSGSSRPTVRSGGTPSRPTVRPSTSERRPAVQRSGGSGSSRPTVRSGGTPSRQTVRPSTSERRPAVQRSGGSGSARPSVRSSGSSSSRPTVRSSGGASSRPSARPSTSPRRPTVQRSAGSSSSRPSVSRSSGSSRPTVRRSSGGASRPAVRSGASGSSRPSASRSSGRSSSSRPSASRSSGRSSGGGASRSGPSRRRGGG